MKYYKLLMSCLIGGLTLFTACNDDEETGGGNPLQLGESGIVTMELSYQQTDTVVQLPVVNRRMRAATVDLVQLTQEELDAYNNRWQTDYLMIPEDAYEMLSSTVSFASGERQKSLEVTIHPSLLYQHLLTQPEGEAKSYALPLKMNSNEESTGEVVYVMNLYYPEMTLTSEEEISVALNAMETPIEISASMQEEGMTTPNGMAVSFRLVTPADKEAWVANYNADNGTSYTLLPEAYFTATNVTGAADAETATGTVTINRQPQGQETLERGVYILPLVPQREDGAQFMLSYDTCAIVIDNPSHLFTSTDKVDREGWRIIFCNSDNGVWNSDGIITNILDGNPGTFWASWYQYWGGQENWWNDHGRGDDWCDYGLEFMTYQENNGVGDMFSEGSRRFLADDYIFIAGEREHPVFVIDMGREYYISEVGLQHRSDTQYAQTRSADIYVSNDPEFLFTSVREGGTLEGYDTVNENNWTHICTVNMEQTTDEFWANADIDDARATGASRGRFLKFVNRDVLREDGDQNYAGLGEIWIKEVATIDGEPVE